MNQYGSKARVRLEKKLGGGVEIRPLPRRFCSPRFGIWLIPAYLEAGYGSLAAIREGTAFDP